MQCSVVQCSAVQFNAVQFNAVQCRAVPAAVPCSLTWTEHLADGDVPGPGGSDAALADAKLGTAQADRSLHLNIPEQRM